MNYPLPLMDCEKCQWREEDFRDEGHCYMFREKPSGAFCGQLTPTNMKIEGERSKP
jgi:hypothetical protein